jgi:hypothetical protein
MTTEPGPPVRRRLTVALDRLASFLLVTVVALIVSFHPKAGHRSRPRLVVIGIDGLSWAILTPAMARGDAPVLAKLVQHTRGILVPTPDQARQSFWDWVGLVRTPSLKDPATGALLAPRPIWDLLSARHSLGMVGWPGLGGVRLYPEASTLELPTIQREGKPTDPSTSPGERLAWDRGHVSAAVKMMQMHDPDYLLIGLGGPFVPESGHGPEHAISPSSSYWTAFDAELGRLLAALTRETTVVVLGRALGPGGTPAADGIWTGSGPGLATGPMSQPVRADEVGPTITYLGGAPLPIGTIALPTKALLDPSWMENHPVRWEVCP